MRVGALAFWGRGFQLTGLLCTLGLLWAPVFAQAQTVSPTDEYRKLITAGQAIQPLGMHPFGESINLYNGSLSFEVTDVGIPGIGPTLQLSRSLSTAGGNPLGSGLDLDRPFGDWDLDIPRIVTMTADQANVTGWYIETDGEQGYMDRCTYFRPPVPVNAQNPSDPPVEPSQWWYGYNLIIPGVGSQKLLGGAAQAPASGTYVAGTKQNWVIKCGVNVDNPEIAGEPGEGFVAIAPNGTTYTFTHLVYRPYFPIGSVLRRQGVMYVTKIEDRFGNTLTYNWSNNSPDDPADNQLLSIVASDGRELTFTYESGTPLIQTVTEVASDSAPTRTWTYTYTSSTSDAEPTLTKVELPDGSAWSYSLGNWREASLDTSYTACPGGGLDYSTTVTTGSMTTPSGLTANFTLTPTLHGRSYVLEDCVAPFAGEPAYPTVPDEYAQFSLTQEVVSGPGIAKATWTWSYSSPNASWTSDPCASSNTCADTVYTDAAVYNGTDLSVPPVRTIRYTFSNRYNYTEGELLSTDSYSGDVGPTPLRSVVNTYAYLPPASEPWPWPWPSSYGAVLQGRVNVQQVGLLAPLTKRVITQDGATFTTQVNTFDDFARAISTTESSNVGPGYSKIDTTTYDDDRTNWVLGLITQTAINGTVDSATDYDSLDQPTSQYAFGRLDATDAWNTNGTLASITDGDNNATGFSNWYRGVPETISFADGSSESATVNGDGWITSITDENGYTTNYTYDPMGRLTGISYPTGDDVAWNSTQLSFAQVNSSELGIPAGHWKQVIQTGNDDTVTYFDAYWRPLVTEHYDAGNEPGTLSQVVDNYDALGRTVFTSYPTHSATSYTQSLPGIHTTYDALGRVTDVTEDSSLGALATTTQYLSGFETEVTDPRGYSTLTSYQAYGQPTHDWPASITAADGQPDAQVTTITRDVFGKPLSILRTGTASGRYYAYNAYQQLCARSEPETGTTEFGYDGAANLVWSVPGLPFTSTPGCYTESQASGSGRMVTRTYNTRNWPTALTYPDSTSYPNGFSNTTWTYAPDGAVLTASVTNGGFPATTTYSYDKRRLLTGETLALPSTSAFSIGYSHDANSHLAATTYPDGRIVAYAPNALGQPTQAGSYATGVSYFPNGAIAGFTFGSGAVHTMTEDERGLVARSTDALNGTAGMDFAYDYDGDGNVAAITDYLSGNVGNVTMTYDALDRLTEAVSPMFGGNDEALYTYDTLNNLTSAAVGNQSPVNYVYNAANQLAELTDPSTGAAVATYAYDVQGNLAQKNSQAYQFDMANRLTGVPNVAAYRYDALGRRVQKVELASGVTLDSDYSKAGQLLYQWNPANADATDYIYVGDTLVAKVVGNDSNVIGNLDGVPSASNPVVGGWACATGALDPISVEIYAGASGSGGTLLGTVTANEASEPAVATSCGTTGANYRFTFTFTQAMRASYGGQAIYVYGVSPAGNGNNALSASGQYTIPPNPSAPPAPASISVPGSSSTGNITVSWSSVSTATSYVLQQQLNGGAWTQVYSGSATSTSLSGLGNGSYVYRAQACNSVGCSAPTQSTTLTVALIPAAPASITVPSSSYSASFGVSWSASANASNYVLEESANGGGWDVVNSGDVTSYTVTVPASGTYRFQVSACGAGGCSGYTVSGNVMVTLPPASAPSPHFSQSL